MEAPQRKKIPAQTVIAMRHEGSHDDIGKAYHALYEWASQKSVKILGKGLTVFLNRPNEFDPKSAVFDVCLQVPPGTIGDDAVTVKELSACEVYAAQVKGAYNTIPAHYAELLAWMDADSVEVTGAPREVYINRPRADGGGDPAEFVTEIQFPIG